MSFLDSMGRSLGESIKKLLRLPLIDEKAIRELLKDLQRALLQSDVNAKLVLDLSKRVEERSLKETLPPGISRREHVLKVLYEELTRFLGEEPAKTGLPPGKALYVLMLVGIQGAGKTTSSVKISRFYQKRGMRPAIICADTFRPGAFEQLKQLAEKVNIPVYAETGTRDVKKIASAGLKRFREEGKDFVIVDTAGRHKDEKELIGEMADLASSINPDEIILVIDGTMGQQAMSQAQAFKDAAPVGSIFLTKLDGSAKGGGALSAVAATGAKIKFVGSGEKIDDLEPFDPPAFVGRLIGLGDVKGLVEKVQEAQTKISEKKAKAIIEGKFTLKDLYDQMESVRKMGPLKKLWQMIPGGYNMPEEAMETAETKFDAWRVIIQSMRKEEVEDPKVIDSSRARRIARGSGTSEREVKGLVNQYFAMKKMLKSMKRRQTAMRKLPFG